MDIDLIWESTLNNLKQNINSHVAYNLYLKDSVAVWFDGKIFTVAVQMTINKNMIDNRYRANIEKILSNILRASVEIDVVISNNPYELRIQYQKEYEEKKAYQEESLTNSYDINPKYTFENFIIGSSNEYATAAAIRTAENPGTVYNPLYLYGAPGLGKTHLMHAIGNSIEKNFPEKKVIYVTSEKFMNDYIENLKTKTPKNFRDKYRNADVLLLDDIQFLENKESTQDELFHTFNELFAKNKQMVFAGDRHPDKLVTLEERMRTRVKSNLVIDITAPSLETRIAILKNKAESKGVFIEENALEYIAQSVEKNVRELEGVLMTVISLSQLKQRKIDIDFVTEVIKRVPSESKITVDKIIDQVCSYYDITKEEIIGKSKTKNFTLPRQVAMYICNILTELNYGAIARHFGNRDRTTVMHNVEKIKDLVKNDSILNADVETIIRELKNV
ncbi:MAG: chromosomal replication initiator protein DnaA [Clostridia bacterium]|nr:chromosomal replication initiator protein DnaA [Clostridia bacterium]